MEAHGPTPSSSKGHIPAVISYTANTGQSAVDTFTIVVQRGYGTRHAVHVSDLPFDVRQALIQWLTEDK